MQKIGQAFKGALFNALVPALKKSFIQLLRSLADELEKDTDNGSTGHKE